MDGRDADYRNWIQQGILQAFPAEDQRHHLRQAQTRLYHSLWSSSDPRVKLKQFQNQLSIDSRCHDAPSVLLERNWNHLLSQSHYFRLKASTSSWKMFTFRCIVSRSWNAVTTIASRTSTRSFLWLLQNLQNRGKKCSVRIVS